MPADKKPGKINVVLYWHMHQPEYRDLRSGEYSLPWTYLHAIKDYVDMVAHIENEPDARAVVNFAPVLLEQIEDYAQQLGGYLKHGSGLRDPLLRALADPVITKKPQQRLALLSDCLRANENRLIDRFDEYKQLAGMAKTILKNPDSIAYYDDQFIADLLVWYHLAWLAETERRKDKRIKLLMKKGCLFTAHDRRFLIEIMHEMIAPLLGRYKKLALDGRIELSMTPYAHPIMPLLIDFKSAREAMPDVELPKAPQYPQGEERCLWHIVRGLQTFQRVFGFTPQGCWPSEGSISDATVELLSAQGFRWLASGETVLRNSLAASGVGTDRCIHTAYQYADTQPACFFRDDGLSDLIGFEYSSWHADDAVANLIGNIENIADACADNPQAIVSIIMDGENAWEYYPENAYYFLAALYKELAAHERINLTTYGDYLNANPPRQALKKVVAGSWVYGTFSTWIGEKDKNQAWDMLVDARRVYDEVMAQNSLSEADRQRAELQLAICEGSDWFWWFGDYNPADSVEAFDEKYRLHLCNLYSILGREIPEYLSHAFSHGSGAPAMGGVMLPGKQH